MKKTKKKPAKKKNKYGPKSVRVTELTKTQVELETWMTRALQAEGALDIINRENAGEPDEDLAQEYGGTSYEKHPAVKSTREIRMLLTGALQLKPLVEQGEAK